MQVLPLGSFFYSKDKNYEGISLKLSDLFLKENGLKWDNSKFCYEKIPDDNLNGTNSQIQKINLLLISANLNLPKIYVQNGLNQIFESLSETLVLSSKSSIDLGNLGNIQIENKMMHHIPVKIKKESIFNAKVSIRGLLLKSLEKSHSSLLLNHNSISNSSNLENNRYNNLINKSSITNSKLSESQ